MMMRWLFFIFLLVVSSVAGAGVSVRLDDVLLRDFAYLVFTDISRRSFVFDHDFIRSPVAVSVSIDDADPAGVLNNLRLLLDAHGFILRDSGGVYYIGKVGNDDDEVLVYRPLYRSADYLIELAGLVFQDEGVFSSVRPVNNPTGNVSVDSASREGASRFISRKDVDAVVFRGAWREIEKLRKLFVQLDRPQGEILVKAVVYEVRNDSSKGNALSLIAGLLESVKGLGLVINAGGVDRENAIRIESGNFRAVWSALSGDSRFKLVSSPVLRIKNGGKARFQAGQDVPVLGSVSYHEGGQAVQDVEYKSSGVILEIAPNIYDKKIDLDISQQISSFTQTSTGVNGSPTLLKRELSTSVSVGDDEIVFLGGLDETSDSDSREGLFFMPSFLRGSRHENDRMEIILMLHVQRL
jgi:type II secretory pathway component GspD/PulD (secretin)